MKKSFGVECRSLDISRGWLLVRSSLLLRIQNAKAVETMLRTMAEPSHKRHQ